MKKTLVLIIALSLVLTSTLFANGKGEADSGTTTPAAKSVVVQIGFENSMSEPIGQAFKKW